ncbi:MAG: hypothetical protein F7C37_03645, partial [Desulfurococcales archaeon]|nr:hypothetical protein [Desulfurococcales archaeon]
GSLEISMSRLNARIPFVVLMRALGFVEEPRIAFAVSADPEIHRGADYELREGFGDDKDPRGGSRVYRKQAG